MPGSGVQVLVCLTFFAVLGIPGGYGDAIGIAIFTGPFFNARHHVPRFFKFIRYNFCKCILGLFKPDSRSNIRSCHKIPNPLFCMPSITEYLSGLRNSLHISSLNIVFRDFIYNPILLKSCGSLSAHKKASIIAAKLNVESGAVTAASLLSPSAKSFLLSI